MLNKREREFVKAAENAIQSGNRGALRKANSKFSSFCYHDDHPEKMSDEVVLFFVEQLASERLHQLPFSSLFVYLLEQNWGQIIPSQRELLLSVLEKSYASFVDFVSQLVISELLGDYYADATALDILTRLAGCTSETGRAMVCVGVGKFIRRGPRDLADRARQLAERLAHDPSLSVRNEAQLVLTNCNPDFNNQN